LFFLLSTQMPTPHRSQTRCIISRRQLVPLLAGLLFAPLSAATDWPAFRGPWGDGQVSAPGEPRPSGLPLTWSETENVVWKTAISDRGWSTPAIMAGQVWLTNATLDGHDFFVLCVDAATGQVRRNDKLFHCDAPEPLGNIVNGYATPSPALEPGRVYVHFGSYGTACLDTATGKTLWQRQDLPCRHYRGPSSSPLLFENLLILTLDGADLQYLIALDKRTGQTVWKTNRSVEWDDAGSTVKMIQEGDRRKAHSTPLLITIDGQPRLLSTGAKAAYAYDPRTGRELWRVRYPAAWSAAPVPVYRQGLAFLITGAGKTELLAVRADGSGDVTDTHVAWRVDTMVARTASPVLVDDLLYMVSDDGLVTCLECVSGSKVWQQRLPGKYAASPIHADGRLYFCNQEGKTTILKPGRTCAVLATNTLPIGLMASPAVAGRALFLRTKTHLYRIEQAPVATAR
jgi:outer membrane protein assembly factor BamB